MSRTLRGAVFLLALAAVLALALERHPAPAPARFPVAEYRPPPGPAQPPRFRRGFLFSDAPTAMVHSGTLAPLADGSWLAAWFGGSREGAGDVALYAARQDRTGWGPPEVLLTRAAAERGLGLHLRKLGNPVLYGAPDGRVWLFFVVVSLGGWSTSTLACSVADAGGRHWTPPRRLVTSPFLNLGTLVRARPLPLTDGGIALPAYHELLGKFGELLRLDAGGRVLAKHRIGQGRSALQPTLAATAPGQLRAWLRRASGAPPWLLTTASTDGGATWSAPAATGLPNPDASVAAVRSGRGDFLLVYNPDPRGRHRLALARSPDGQRWESLMTLEQGAEGDEFSYPFLVRDTRGTYRLIYTWQRRRMAWVEFNDAWLEARR
jgi:predicted neuraminidase